MKGKHDDLIMAIAMALYVGENSFSQLKKADSLTKAMLNSWTTSGSDNGSTQEPEHRRPQQNTGILGIPGNHSNDSRQQYKDYGWLFVTYEGFKFFTIYKIINIIKQHGK